MNLPIQLRAIHWLLSIFLASVFIPVAFGRQSANPDREFQDAVAQYNAGRFAEAAGRLEDLVRELPENFEVHELLGLVYSAQSQDAKANAHLQEAVRLKPDSAAARSNLAANLLRMGKPDAAGIELKKAVELEPGNFDANHNLGELYVRAGKIAAAVPYLEHAQRINGDSYDNGYDLSLAYLLTERFSDARRQVRILLDQKNTAELHNLLGQIEEKDGQFVAAVNEFETAAHMDSSESNLFDWGTELLLHRTLDAAVKVFQEAVGRYPDSTRLYVGLGMALYSRGNYDDAVHALLKAADLNPSDPRCYYFLSKAYDSSPRQADEVIERFRRFADLQPENARAVFYYAMSLWKGKRAEDGGLDFRNIETLLKRAVALDPNLADAHLQLGNLAFDQKKYAESIPEYKRALHLSPAMADAHYRLGQAYVHTGEKDLARQELATYQRLRTRHLAELDERRAEIRQFVYSEKETQTAKP